MKISKNQALINLTYKSIIVAPFKVIPNNGASYRVEDNKDADIWIVLGEGKTTSVRLGEFTLEDQDLAHQFAELLTICLNQVKTFQNENLQTETK